MRVLSTVMGSALAMASIVSSTSILIPLYVWPEDITTWSPIYNTASENPDIEFHVIINPNSGPGDSTYPDPSYIDAVSKLNSFSNVKTLGYIDTWFTTVDVSTVKEQISTYAGWANYDKENITISGIFFDDAPRENDETKILYMQEISEAAKSTTVPFVVFNPGTTLEEGSLSGYFDAADLIVECENTYDTWISTAPVDQFSRAEFHKKDAVILNEAPLDADYESVIQEAKQMGLGAAYLTNVDNYDSVDSVSKVVKAFTASG